MPPPPKNEEDKIKKFSYCDEVTNIVSVDWVLKDESPDWQAPEKYILKKSWNQKFFAS